MKLLDRASRQIVKQSAGIRKRLAQHGAEALKAQPRIEEDATRQRWWRSQISGRQARVARKQAILSGTFGRFDEAQGGWLPEWDIVKEPRILIPGKRHKRERTRAARAAAIEKNMREMPTKIEVYKKEIEARKPPPGIETLLKRLAKHK